MHNPKSAVISIIQNMVLIIDNQGFVGEDILGIFGNGVVEDSCNFENEVIVIGGDCWFNFTGGFAHCSYNIPINTDRFVTGGFVVQTIIGIAEVVLERGFDEAVANFHS